jgi:anti-sigma regulatory factor (Ser/Thr protein kinase)
VEHVWTACIALPPEDTSPRTGRALLRAALDQWHVGDLDSVDLLLTEVVTNAVVHAHTHFTLHLSATPGWVRVEVRDCSPEPPRRRRPTSRSEHGRGLLLLDRLAQRWGWEEHPDSATCKAVWFEITAGSTGDHDDPALYAAFDLANTDPL